MWIEIWDRGGLTRTIQDGTTMHKFLKPRVRLGVKWPFDCCQSGFNEKCCVSLSRRFVKTALSFSVNSIVSLSRRFMKTARSFSVNSIVSLSSRFVKTARSSQWISLCRCQCVSWKPHVLFSEFHCVAVSFVMFFSVNFIVSLPGHFVKTARSFQWILLRRWQLYCANICSSRKCYCCCYGSACSLSHDSRFALLEMVLNWRDVLSHDYFSLHCLHVHLFQVLISSRLVMISVLEAAILHTVAEKERSMLRRD